MLLLSNNTEIKDKLTELISKCKDMQIAVAWATTNHDVFKTLIDNKDKIKKFVVGTHFYQTDPKFLEEFIDDERVKVIKNTGEVFHPKIYYFNTEDGWECLIGSANFTNGAMNKNEEIMVCISSDDYNSETTKMYIWKQIHKWFEVAEVIYKRYIEDYRKHYVAKQKSLQILSSGNSISVAVDNYKSDIFSMSWNEYFNKLSSTDHKDLEDRLNVIIQARTLFESYAHFKDFSDIERKKIAGFYENQDDGIDWLLFGSMKPTGLFKQQINQNNQNLSLALDKIPLSGTIAEKDYTEYIKKFKLAFEDDANRLAAATRLLAMKRPDYFICLDSKNKELFCADFGLKENDITLDTYWEVVVNKMCGCLWWTEDESKINNEHEHNIYRSRVAFLDKLYYNNAT